MLWTQAGFGGEAAILTVVGNSIVHILPTQYFAFDQATGAVNHFWAGPFTDGGGSTVAYDAARQQFYVLEVITVAPGPCRPTTTLTMRILRCCGNALAQAFTLARWQSAQPATSIPQEPVLSGS